MKASSAPTPAVMASTTTAALEPASHLFWASAALVLHAAGKPAEFFRAPHRRHQRGCRPLERLPARRLSAARSRNIRCRCPAIISRNSARASLRSSTPATFCPSRRTSAGTSIFNGATASVDYLSGTEPTRQLGQRRRRGHFIPRRRPTGSNASSPTPTALTPSAPTGAAPTASAF